MVTYTSLFKTVLFTGSEMLPKQNVPSALPSHTSAKHPCPSFFSRDNEPRATSQASLANPEVCGVQLDEITVKLKHKPSAFSTGKGINKKNTVLIIHNHACTRKDGRWLPWGQCSAVSAAGSKGYTLRRLNSPSTSQSTARAICHSCSALSFGEIPIFLKK